jgi:hypothetical protein
VEREATVPSHCYGRISIEGIATQVTGDFLELAKRMEAKRGKPLPVDQKDFLSKGHVWYKLTPTKILAMHSEQFGYDRRELPL